MNQQVWIPDALWSAWRRAHPNGNLDLAIRRMLLEQTKTTWREQEDARWADVAARSVRVVG